MMVRTIQHPGIQIQESEIGSYKSTVVMNNAYIMGFTDKGPIYDYSFITTTSEFTKIYGEPQTEAEKYLFIAVQSVLSNGGTPIVARMPYDNKQCKAYKALKMKWIDKTDMIGTKKIDTDLATPIIPLSAVTDELNTKKSFAEIFTKDNVTVDGVSYDDCGNISVVQAVELLNPYESGTAASSGELYEDIKDLVTLKINGVLPSNIGVSQEAVSSIVQSLKTDMKDYTLKINAYNAGEDIKIYSSEEEITERFYRKLDEVQAIRRTYISVTVPVSAGADETNTYYINPYEAVSSTFNDTEVYGCNDIPEEAYMYLLETAVSSYLTCNDDGICGISIPTSFYIPGYWTDPFIPENILSAALSAVLSGSYASKSFESGLLSAEANDPLSTAISGKYSDTVNRYISGYCYSEVYTSAWIPEVSGSRIDALNTIKSLSAVEYGDILGYYDYTFDSKEAGFLKSTTIDSKPVYTKFSNDLSGLINAFAEVPLCGNISAYIEAACDQGIQTGLKAGGQYNESISPIHDDKAIDTLVPVFSGTKNCYILNKNGKLGCQLTFDNYKEYNKLSGITLVGFLNEDAESPAIDGEIYLSGTAYTENQQAIFGITSALPVWNEDDLAASDYAYAIDKTKTKGFGAYNRNTFGDFITNGDVDFIDYYAVNYLVSLKDYKIVDIDNEFLADADEYFGSLLAIYNNPALMNMDEDNYTILESKLLQTPEMGFKYGLYIDSEECEISNDQYDDLLTVNQFKAVDRTIDKYGEDIDDCNFIIVDKQKSVVAGAGGNIGFFTTIIDPFDALKVQRLLVNPEGEDASTVTFGTTTFDFDHSESNMNNLDYWGYESRDAWNTIYDDLLDSMDCLERVRNADGVYIGEPNPTNGKQNILDSWSVPLTGDYYSDSVSKELMRKFPGISMADLTSEDLEDPNFVPSIIDHTYSTHIMVAVCKTTIDQSNGKICVNIIETHFGSLFDEKNPQNGRSLFIGDIINANSDYIEFYRNDYVSAGDKGAYDPVEYRRTEVNQIFIKDSEALKNAAQLRGIDYDDIVGLAGTMTEEQKEAGEKDFYTQLEKYHIYAINKKEVCIYNLNWESNLTSFSKKESQKVIANTTGLYSVNDGTTTNVANNFLIDMDRCIRFVKNVDSIPLHFICDAGLSTIAQFCDNVVWNPKKKSVIGEETDPITGKKTGIKIYVTTGGWITQPFDPDNDPDGEDRYITGYADVATWRKVVEKIISIAGEIRKDCFAIIDAPRQLTLDGAAPKIRRSKITNDFNKTIGKYLRYISGINSSYAAGYYNWLRTVDQYTGVQIWCPPTAKIIGNYCYLNIMNLPWLAPAGLTYGLISGCSAVSHNPDYKEEDEIYLKSWNYIKQYPMEGLVVEGQRTLLGKESVFERVNVRLLFLDLERFAYNVSRTFKYQVNNAYTREQFVATLKPKFEDYTLRGGIYEYYIKVDSTNNTPETIDKNELRGDIFIKPARLIEFILLNFVGTSSSVNFSELQLG